MENLKEAIRNVTVEETLKAIEIVQSLINSSAQIEDDVFAGDKDTLFYAFSRVLESHNIYPSSRYDVSDEDANKYFEIYEDEINFLYHKLVKNNNKMQELYSEFKKYLTDSYESFKEFKNYEIWCGTIIELTEFHEEIIPCFKCGKDMICEVPTDKSYLRDSFNKCNECVEKDNLDELPF